MGEGRGGARRVRSAILPAFLPAFLVFGLFGCESSTGFGPGGVPGAPVGFDALYFDQAVHLSWEIGPGWDGEPFRIFGKRVDDPNYFLVAEVTNCSEGFCSYRDVNVLPDITYVYYVAAVAPDGTEAPSEFAIEVFVPTPTPPPAPSGIQATALDGAIFVEWNDDSRSATDFAFYRVYFYDGDQGILIGETDSEGFLDLLTLNGSTYEYFVTAVDDQGHESEGTTLAAATPRPDYQGEFLLSYEDWPEQSGFQFQLDDQTDPVVDGDDPSRHFRLESDLDGWYLVPGPGAQVHPVGTLTTALRCGPAADPNCLELSVAPQTGYVSTPIILSPERSYAWRVAVNGDFRHGVVRITHLGFAEEGAFAIFDWAYQLQLGNPNLVPPAPGAP